MEQQKTRLTELKETKVEETMKTISMIVEDTYAKVVARSNHKKNETAKPKKEKSHHHNIEKSSRIQVIPEDVEKLRGENLKNQRCSQDYWRQPQIMETKRPGKYSKQRAKPRTILVTISREHEARMDLANL